MRLLAILTGASVVILHAQATGTSGSRGPALAVPTAVSPIADSPAVPVQDGSPSSRIANYLIEVRLDASTRMLTGREVLTWRNLTNVPTQELRFHLYYNAWKSSRSTWMREWRLGSSERSLAQRPREDWGWIKVSEVRLIGGSGEPFTDLTGQMSYIQPDDDPRHRNLDDETVMSVRLPKAVRAGETINLQLLWKSKVPRTFARTGAIGNFFFLAHWFPKVGVFEGQQGWNCHQFHAATEFFADYGVYDVRMTVPQGWVVGATGIERERHHNEDGTTTHRYYQEDVHDFAWTTSPDYLVFDQTFKHAPLPEVRMRLLLQPEHAGQQARHFRATEAALRHYGQWYGPYPYGHVTIVDPAYQSDAGGMEYPTLFTAGTRWIAPRAVHQPESVTVHEAGHQFWYGLVGNNEFEHAWLDEGLNTFSTARVLAESFARNRYSVRFFGGFIPKVFDIELSREIDGNRLSSYRAGARMDIPATPTFKYWPPTASAISYAKTALWLHTLERYLGWPTLQRILATFFDRWKFQHPTPQDFFDVVNEVSRRDLTWFFDEVYRSSNVFDYGIQSLVSERVRPQGLFEVENALQFKTGEDSPQIYETTVVVRRYGEAIFPIEIAVVFDNNDRVRERWDGRDRSRMFSYNRAARAIAAQVDPDRTLALDVNYTNNSRTLHPQSDRASIKWASKWMVWLQDLLMTYAFFV